MQQRPIYFKTDFKVFVKTEAGFAVPFQFEFYTDKPSKPFVAKYDGEKYIDCQLMEDGRLLVAIEPKNFGFGTLMIKQTYFLTDPDYPDKVCDRVIDPRPVIDLSNPNNPCEIFLGPEGDDNVEFTVELPPYYQAGLTPEEHEALINETNAAHAAAASANEEAEKAKEQTEASKKQMEEVNADYTKLKGDLQKAYTDTTTALAKDYTDKKAALDADYAAKKQALENDYTSVKAALGQDYTETKTAIANEYAQKQTALAAEYQAKQEALAADYARDLKSLNDRMTAIENQYAIDKAAWQKQTTDFIAECRSTFTTNEAARQKSASDQRKAEKQTFDAQIAAQDTTFQSKEAQRDAAVTEATKVSQTVAIHDRAISPYSKSIPLPLTANLATGSILAMEGDMVVLKAQPGWGITRIDREEFGTLGLASGDTLLLPMAHFDAQGKPTDNLMLMGAVLFAAEEAVKGQSGEVLYTRRTSLFRATDNAIATWGGVKKWLAIADNESLLICHPLDITSATITRNGNDAANAAADLNQRRRIEEKLNLGGKDPRAWVGMADQLAPSEKTEQAAYRDEFLPAGRILGFAPELGPSGAGTRDGQIADSVSPVMREVSGVSGGWNQFLNPNGDNKRIENSGNLFYSGNPVNIPNGNKFMTVISATFDKYSEQRQNAIWRITGIGMFDFGKADEQTNGYIGTSQGGATVTISQNWQDSKDENAGTMHFARILNLTLLPQLPATFVASLGASDAHRVAHALGFLALQRD